jgi:phosphosulfolactate phosphohydrolase-like enzyme
VKVFLKISVPGAREAAARSDVVAIIDALRASVTIIIALIVGAVKVIPVLTGALPNATALAQATFDLAGERRGDISLIVAGVEDEATLEDLVVARLIAQRLAMMGSLRAEGDWSDHAAESEAAEVLRSSPSGQKLKVWATERMWPSALKLTSLTPCPYI